MAFAGLSIILGAVYTLRMVQKGDPTGRRTSAYKNHDLNLSLNQKLMLAGITILIII